MPLQQHIIPRVLAGFVAFQLLIMPLFWVLSVSAVKSFQQYLLFEEKGEIVSLSLTPEEFANIHFIEDEEMIWQGVFYDIKSIEKINGRYFIKALADEHETVLNNINPHKNDKNKKQAKPPLKMPVLFIEDFADNICCLSVGENNLLSITQIYCSGFFKNTPSQPPENL